MPKNPKTQPVNWRFKVVCKDCNTEFDIEEPDPTIDVLENRHRMFMLTIPNECPECHNLKVVVSNETDSSDC